MEIKINEAGTRIEINEINKQEKLEKQPSGEVDNFGITSDTIVADSSNPGWKDGLTDYLLDIKNGISDSIIVLTTHNTFSSEDFIKIIRR